MKSDTTQPSGGQLLTVRETQQRLCCGRSTLRKLRAARRLVPLKHGKSVRYLACEVGAYVAALISERDGTAGPGRPRST